MHAQVVRDCAPHASTLILTSVQVEAPRNSNCNSHSMGILINSFGEMEVATSYRNKHLK